MKSWRWIAAAAALAMIALPVASGSLPVAAQDKTVELTVYNQDMALVSEGRTVPLEAGVNEVVYSDVAALIDPTSVSFQSLTDPEGTTVLEQNFEYDIVDSFKLLEKYIDQEIVVESEDSEVYQGTLLSASDNIILQAEDGSVVLLSRDKIRNVSFPALPEGLRTRPSLVWLIDAAQAGDHATEVTYITHGMGWHADYVMQLDEDSSAFDLDGWVTLDNRSGASYTDAKLKLVAGDVNVVKAEEQLRYDMMEMPAAAAAEPAVQQRAFFEYHLYEVQRPVTVNNNQTKQIEFVTGSDVPATKFYVYNGAALQYYPGVFYEDPGYGADTGNTDVAVMLEFRTDAESNLETELPAGRIRIYQEDVDGSPLLVGEDAIDHTPVDETVRLSVGNAFDIVGERVQTDYKRLGDSGAEETFRITLRNHKQEDVEVRVVENLYRSSDWQIISQTLDGEPAEHTVIDSNTVEWRVPVPADGEAELIYTVQYLWK
jgi:hypothetical protein